MQDRAAPKRTGKPLKPDENETNTEIRDFLSSVKNKGRYLARFVRKTIDDDIIVARIHEHGAGLEDLTVKTIIGHYKKEVLEALS